MTRLKQQLQENALLNGSGLYLESQAEALEQVNKEHPAFAEQLLVTRQLLHRVKAEIGKESKTVDLEQQYP